MKSDAAAFWSRVERLLGEDACWLWRGARNGDYGCGPRGEPAHRYAWRLENGPIPAGLLALHRCDVPLCVRASHLFLGTHSDNARDCWQKGRHPVVLPPPMRGEAHPRARLTERLVREIRDRYQTGDLRQVDLADEYGVGQAHISRIVRKAAWAETPA